MRQGRGSEATEAIFCLQAKKPLHTGVRAVRHDLIMLLNKIIIRTFSLYTGHRIIKSISAQNGYIIIRVQ